MHYHVWFITKYRKTFLEGGTDVFVKNVLSECIQRHNYKVLEMETNKDHMHMLVEAKDKTELSAIVRILKSVSAKEVLRTPHFRVGNFKHLWGKRYGYREIAKESEIEIVAKYIREQKKIPHTGVCGEKKRYHTRKRVE